MKKAVWMVLVATLTMGPAVLGLSQPYRDNLALPANEIYQKLLSYTQDRDFERELGTAFPELKR